MIHTITITVIGMGEFPIDMLRYDGLHPATEADSALIARGRSQIREISLNRLFQSKSEMKSWAPTRGRWLSFGWAITQDVCGPIGRSDFHKNLEHVAEFVRLREQGVA